MRVELRDKSMRKLLFSVCVVLPLLGCGGENVDDLPPIGGGDDYGYYEYGYCGYGNNWCEYMNVNECYNYGGSNYGSDSDCGVSHSSYGYCGYYNGNPYVPPSMDYWCEYMSVDDCGGRNYYGSDSNCGIDYSSYGYCGYHYCMGPYCNNRCNYMSIDDCYNFSSTSFSFSGGSNYGSDSNCGGFAQSSSSYPTEPEPFSSSSRSSSSEGGYAPSSSSYGGSSSSFPKSSGSYFNPTGNLWYPNIAYGIAHFPWVRECIHGSDFDETNSNDPCFKYQGGWWFGYVAGPGTGAYRGECKGYSSSQNSVIAIVNAGEVSFVRPDYYNCEGPYLIDISDGSSMIGDAFRVKFRTKAAYEEPEIAGIGLNFSSDGSIANSIVVTRDISRWGGGYCLTYTSTDVLELELGWDEATYGLDTWYSRLPASANRKTVDIRWDDFDKYGWGSGENNQPISTAVQKAISLKIHLRNGTPNSKDVDFELYELGWAGECGGI